MTNELKIKHLNINTGRNAIIYLNNSCLTIAKQGFDGTQRVEIKHKDKSFIASLNILHDSKLLTDTEVGFGDLVFKKLALPEGASVEITSMAPVTSLVEVKNKMLGKKFTEQGLFNIISDVAKGRYSDAHTAAFCTACEGKNLDIEEITYLTKAMVAVGNTLKWHTNLVVDKHCIGGIPGNRTTVVVIPIIAAAGLCIPKTSSRAITSPSGTADTMEVMTNVSLSQQEMMDVVKKENGCIVWGGSVSLSPADDIIIKTKREINMDSEGQMVASVLSKKLAAGSTHILIDIPAGPTAKVKNPEDGAKLKNCFETIGKNLGANVKVVITDGIQPVGNGIGPALEAKDIVSVLKDEKSAPQDLKEKSIELAGIILEMAGKSKAGEGEKLARELLESGKAWTKFQTICKAQGGMKEIPTAKFVYEVTSSEAGKVTVIDNKKLSDVTRTLGAPEDVTAGIYLYKHLNDSVSKGEVIFTIHTNSEGKMQLAKTTLESTKIMTIK